MNILKVLDVTLRDGGCVNNFNFGQSYMEKILYAQEMAGIEIIELGYVDSKKGTVSGRTQFSDERVIYENFLKKKKSGVAYVAMFDHGNFDPDQLEQRNENSIDGLRMAFHKKDWRKSIEEGKTVLKKGYQLYIQPMLTLRYSDAELLELIQAVNSELPDATAFYIVDSFGEMRPNDMNRILSLVAHHLVPSMDIGFHSHNNLQLSYSNAMTLLQFPTNRNIMIDSSIIGMGKGAGNLCTELLLEHLNAFYGKNYNISPILEVIDSVINQIRSEIYWGYSVEYYLSSANHCSPSYAKHFYDKHMMPIDQVGELLSIIDESKKISFDVNYAEELYRKYNEEKSVDDTLVVSELSEKLKGKNILLIAPGKSITSYKELIQKRAADENVITIGLNSFAGFKTDYVLITRIEPYKSAVKEGENIIVTSNISKGGRGNVAILDYKRWIVVDESTHDSSGVVALNLLEKCKVNAVELAGFDGFSSNINDNYHEPDMRRPVSEVESEQRNRFFASFVKTKRANGMKISFITPSKYNRESAL